MHPYQEVQRRLNRESADAWSLYAQHRRHVWELLSAAGEHLPDDHTLCVLGAGNTNDLDLGLALEAFSSVELVDWDNEALERGTARQGVAGHPRLQVSGGFDLLRDRLAGTYELVVSCCVLSQLIGAVVADSGLADQPLVDEVLRTRDQHLASLVELAAPNGAAILITDWVSSDTAPELLQMPTISAATAANLIQMRNFFTGCNPDAVASRLLEVPGVAAVDVSAPWTWHVGRARAYAVTGITAWRDGSALSAWSSPERG